MTKTDLIAQVAANTEMSKKSAEQAVNAVFEALSKAMSEGEKITISGFGTFEMRERAERQGINPRTREPITIAASRSIVFKPGKSLKMWSRAPRMWPARCTRSLRRASRHKSPGPVHRMHQKRGDEPCRKKHPETRSPRRTI